MRLIAQVLLALVLAAALGLGLTWAAVRHPPQFGAMSAGPWVAHPIGSNVDPYTRAAIATDGTLPMARGDGLAFVAASDDAGRALDGRCFYRIGGPVPSARAWTLSAQTKTGGVFDNPSGRAAFTSGEVLRDADGHVAIVTGPAARPGDWLPTGRAPFVLVLRLYDTSVNERGSALAGTLPAIRRTNCS